MTMCIIPLGIHHLPARKQQEQLHNRVDRFDWLNLTLALKGCYTVPVKGFNIMYALESFVCQEAWIKPAIAPHLPVWPSNSPSCKNKGDFTAPSSHIAYKKHRVTAFSSLMTDRQGRQTDTSLHVIFSFFWHTLGWLCTFQLCRGCWRPACLQSAAGESPGTPGRAFWEHPQKPSVTAGQGLHLSSPSTH